MPKKGGTQLKARGNQKRGVGGGGGPGGGALLQAQEGYTQQKDAWKRRQNAAAAVRKEESAFSKLDQNTLESLTLHAIYTELKRPIDVRLTRFESAEPQAEVPRTQVPRSIGGDAPVASSSSSEIDPASGPSTPRKTSSSKATRLSLPKKPKWSTDLTAHAVQANEAEVFRQWLHKTDAQMFDAFMPSLKGKEKDTEYEDEAPGSLVATIDRERDDPTKTRVPSLFERNLTVYQQLWRVIGRSHILLVLLDVRCPPLHLPPSLVEYLLGASQAHSSKRRTVLVLTKADLVSPELVKAWEQWLSQKYPMWDVVSTSSYMKREAGEGQGRRMRFTSYLSPDSRTDLLNAIEASYNRLLSPPPGVSADAEKLRAWKERRQEEEKNMQSWEKLGAVDFDRIRQQSSESAGENAPQNTAELGYEHAKKQGTAADLVIGLIGQPNVGKSSLMNALLGAQKVRASKTPGKTKHYQTHLLLNRQEGADPRKTSRVMLCDSPGLVFPSLVGMEQQVLCGILPISQMQAASSCIEFVGHRMPLEKALDVAQEVESHTRSAKLTAFSILEALAHKLNFKTAKAGRPDTNRVANLVMRSLAEGKIKWAFAPPTENTEHALTANGIWLPEQQLAADQLFAQEEQHEAENSEDDDESAGEKKAKVAFKEEVESRELSDPPSSDSDASYSDAEEVTTHQSRFAALQIE